MNQLLNSDVHFVVSRIPKDIRELMQKYPIFIGGGFIRSTISGERVSDIDLFGPNLQTLQDAAKDLGAWRAGSKSVHSKNATTILCTPRFPVQFIRRWLFTSLSTLTESFDYTVCQAAIGWEKVDEEGKWISSCSDRFYPDLAARRLVYTSPARNEDAGGSMMRLRKFMGRGYNIQAGSMAAVIARLCAGIDMHKLNALADAHGNDREAALTNMITNLLREVDPLTIIDGVDFLDEHEAVGVEVPQ